MHDDGYFDESVARTYDSQHDSNDPDLIARTADTLGQLAFDDTVLEFAIGTGRIALPLYERGVRIKGIELSNAMVDQLRKKPNGAAIDVTIGDMTTTQVAGHFSLVFLVFNTIDNLTSQDAQLACFQNAASHLKPGGRFVVETLVPPVQRIPYGETSLAFACTDDHWGIDTFDTVSQSYTSHHLWLNADKPARRAIPFRYAWPAELDLMAKIAGLELEHRWADWDKSPFTHLSKSHVSVWKNPT